jgi:glycerol-3-phosphate dehydrogenase
MYSRLRVRLAQKQPADNPLARDHKNDLPRSPTPEFSHRTRAANLAKLKRETFDLLVIGGGITGAAVARDAASRGLTVALVEKNDFAWGTSSRSSKLIHGGLRYLEQYEFALVFESLAERSLLLKTAPHMVRPLEFFFPVYEGQRPGMTLLSAGMWLYDLLALFRTPYFHSRLSPAKFTEAFPGLSTARLLGGFRYADASMWDDVMVLEVLRAALTHGAVATNYTEAEAPIVRGGRCHGYWVRDMEATPGTPAAEPFAVEARQVIVCTGPWTDIVGEKLAATPDRSGAKPSKPWANWLTPSKGVHIVFSAERLKAKGALVMAHPTDGRIAFVIPRPDFGPGVVVVGTTDSPGGENPDTVQVEPADAAYLLGLLNTYFPGLGMTESDILSAYVGVRPLVGSAPSDAGSDAEALQQVSREHYIAEGPAGVVFIAGGKYTTHRTMAEEIVEKALNVWQHGAQLGHVAAPHEGLLRPAETRTPMNPAATPAAMDAARAWLSEHGITLDTASDTLIRRYGVDAVAMLVAESTVALPGFPALDAQLRYAAQHEMVQHLDDFYFRRTPLYLTLADHGLSVAPALARVLSAELGLEPGSPAARQFEAAELHRLNAALAFHESWRRASASQASVEVKKSA